MLNPLYDFQNDVGYQLKNMLENYDMLEQAMSQTTSLAHSANSKRKTDISGQVSSSNYYLRNRKPINYCEQKRRFRNNTKAVLHTLGC